MALRPPDSFPGVCFVGMRFAAEDARREVADMSELTSHREPTGPREPELPVIEDPQEPGEPKIPEMPPPVPDPPDVVGVRQRSLVRAPR
jgi:hypothetical protein